jgi:hypothetical protein
MEGRASHGGQNSQKEAKMTRRSRKPERKIFAASYSAFDMDQGFQPQSFLE